jgi:hypothetical protein
MRPLCMVGAETDGGENGPRASTQKNSRGTFFSRQDDRARARIIGDKEPFDYYLSAFLNASRTVDYRLRHEQGATYTPWRTAWDARPAPEQCGLVKFISADRNVEVHASGSNRNVAQEGVELGIGTHNIDGGVLTIDGPIFGMESVGVCYRPTYSFIIDGTERKVTEACATHLALLQRMVAQFEADHP